MLRAWWGICTRLYYKFPTESNSERILKIGQYLVKLWARVRCLVFLTHGVSKKIQKNHILTLLFIYFRLFTLYQKKTNSNCCTAALSVYLLLFNASYYLHSPSTACGALYRRSACIDMDMLRLATAACCDMG